MKGLTELPKSLFRILDTETNDFWKAGQSKSVWLMIGHAKASWTSRQYRIKFNDQSRYKIVRYTTEKWLMEVLE